MKSVWSPCDIRMKSVWNLFEFVLPYYCTAYQMYSSGLLKLVTFPFNRSTRFCWAFCGAYSTRFCRLPYTFMSSSLEIQIFKKKYITWRRHGYGAKVATTKTIRRSRQNTNGQTNMRVCKMQCDTWRQKGLKRTMMHPLRLSDGADYSCRQIRMKKYILSWWQIHRRL